MNEGLNQPQNPRNRKSRRRRRNFGSRIPAKTARITRTARTDPATRGVRADKTPESQQSRRPRRGGSAFVGPMDHSYRNQGNGNTMQGARFHNGAQATPKMEPLTQRVDASNAEYLLLSTIFSSWPRSRKSHAS